MTKERVSIIGTGALGSILARALAGAGYSIVGLYNRTRHKALHLIEDTGAKEVSSFPDNIHEVGQVIIIAVGDQQIIPVAHRLSGLGEDFSNYIFVHCSGSKPSSALRVLKAKNASVASFHPLQTFTAQSRPSDFDNIYIDIEGDEQAVGMLEQMAGDLGANPMRISPEAKPYLHAAAVMASNNVVALIEAATEIAAMGDINKGTARKALLPLLQQSVENIASSKKLFKALSGPVARGDAETVEDHLKLLEPNSRLQALYKQLGLVLAELADKESGDARYQKLLKRLEEF